ncbi:MAG: histidine phosphatase family protein [Polyangiaceae bacterium]|nr:histidine phosphatase family protein [Polyangiaceae bacterium]
MSVLCLVRHGQASIHADDYDVLSELGVAQARATGAHLARRTRFDAVYSGPRRRQRDTARHVLETAAELGVPQPEPTVLDEFDEFVLDPLWMATVAELVGEHPALVDALRASGRRPVPPAHRAAVRAYQARIEVHMQAWIEGRLALEGLEPYAHFEARVAAGLARVRAVHAGGKHVLVVTSAGTVSAVARLALGLDAQKTVDLVWSLANASLTELRYSGDRLSLASLNAVAHLERDLVTYR